jgi:hypothetical protein
MSIQKHVKQVIDEWLVAPCLTREWVAEQLGYDLKNRRAVVSGKSIITEVKERMAFVGREPFDSTILRKMRKLREQGYKITCIDNRRSIYALEG